MSQVIKTLLLAGLLAQASVVTAQEATEATEETAAPAEDAQDASEDELLTQAELENLVAPIALFPDTVLMQILIAATVPLEIVKAEKLLADNEGKEIEEVTPIIEAEEFDESVEVLAIGFPEIISAMSANIDWTETMGLAMLAQTDDVLAAVQTMRQTAINAGTLTSGDEMTVTQDETDATVIQPTDPEVVYVPQYDTDTVYVEQEDTSSDWLRNLFFAAGTVYFIDEIFSDDDDRYYYWGCGNCGGWNGRPIVGNPNVRPNIDGDVNINIDNSTNIGWRPDDDRKREARRDIVDERRPAGERASQLPAKNKPSRTDDLRRDLNTRLDSNGGAGAGGGALKDRAATGDRPQIKQPANRDKPVARPKQDAVKKPALSGGGAKKSLGDRAGGGKSRASIGHHGGHGKNSGRNLKRR